MTPRTKRQKFKKALKITLAAFAACILILAVWLIAFLNAKPTITVNYLEQYNELSKPKNYNEQDNAWPLYQAAVNAYKRMPDDLSAQLGCDRYYLATVWPDDLDPNARESVRKWLTSNEPAFHYSSLAAKKSCYWIEHVAGDKSLIRDSLPGVDPQDFYRLFRTDIIARATFYAHAGEPHKAFLVCKEIYSLSMHFDSTKGLLEESIGAWMRAGVSSGARTILANSPVDSKMLTEFQAFLEHHNPAPLTFWSEELGLLFHTQKLFTHNARGNGHLILREYLPTFEPHYNPQFRNLRDTVQSEDWSIKLSHMWEYLGFIWAAIVHDDRKQTTEKIGFLCGRLNDLAVKTPYDLYVLGTTYEQEIQKVLGSGQGLFLQESAFGFTGALVSYHQSTNGHAALIAIVALMKYKADKGAYPTALGELQEGGYLSTLPQDPYSDQPLVYRRMGDDFTLYSVGRNFRDDGGKCHEWSSNSEGFDYVYWPVPILELPKESQSAYGTDF